jgi:exodeoxyribonuclease VII small subunit
MNADRTPPPPSPTTPEPASFEAALARLEKLVQELESGQLGLEQSLASFEEGKEPVRRCARELKRVEARVKILTEEAGRIGEQDWTPDTDPPLSGEAPR